MYQTLKISGENITQVFRILFKERSLEMNSCMVHGNYLGTLRKQVPTRNFYIVCINVIVTIDDPSFETPFSGFHKVNAHSNFDFDITLPYSHVNFRFVLMENKNQMAICTGDFI